MKLLKYAALALGVMALSGVSFAKDPLKSVGKSEGQVDIVAWADYIERGATDKKFD